MLFGLVAVEILVYENKKNELKEYYAINKFFCVEILRIS